MTRRDVIRNRLCEYVLEELGCAVACPSKEALTNYPVPGHLFGWFPPMPLDDDYQLVVVSFSPELLAEITAWLDDDELDAYLSAVEQLVDCYLRLLATAPELSPSEQQIWVEREMLDANPDALDLVSRVELQAVDSGIVQTAIL